MRSARITSSGIPTWTYCDPDAFAWEREYLFRRSWGFACLAREVDEPGAYAVASVGGDSVLVVHDGERRRAFHNVCRHRGAEVMAGSGVASEFRCPYHAWTYRLDGVLDRVPGVREIPQGIGLRELRVETWGPFVFVCSDRDVEALGRFFGDVFEDVGSRVDLAAVAEHGTTDEVNFEVEANWKVVVENSLECYHCRFAHPGLAESLELSRYRQWTGRWWSTQQVPQHTAEPVAQTALGEASRRGADESGMRTARFNFLFPNLYVSVWPGSEGFSTTEVQPLGPHRTRTRFRRFFKRRVSDVERNESRAFSRAVIDEDIALCESVQRGLDRRLGEQRLVIGTASEEGADESCIAHFHALLREKLDWAPPAANGESLP